MHVIICGGRGYHLTPDDLGWLDALRHTYGITTVLHGAARGVDTASKIWANGHGLQVRPFPLTPSDWEREGPRAGPIRNTRMLAALQEGAAEGKCAVIAFEGNRGTADMVAKARAAGVPVWQRDTDRPTTAQAASAPRGVPAEASGQGEGAVGQSGAPGRDKE